MCQERSAGRQRRCSAQAARGRTPAARQRGLDDSGQRVGIPGQLLRGVQQHGQFSRCVDINCQMRRSRMHREGRIRTFVLRACWNLAAVRHCLGDSPGLQPVVALRVDSALPSAQTTAVHIPSAGCMLRLRPKQNGLRTSLGCIGVQPRRDIQQQFLPRSLRHLASHFANLSCKPTHSEV